MVFAYDWGMGSLEMFLDEQLANGKSHFSRRDALQRLSMSPEAFSAAATRLIKRQKLVNPRHEFFLIQRPEDRISGAPDPKRWIDALMVDHKIDYRVALLSAAAFHGSSHQAAMVFQVIVPKQLRNFELGRYRIQFVYQGPPQFSQVNRSEWLRQIKSEEGFAKVSGIELTLLDCIRYYHKALGINGVAQIARDIGQKADPRKLARAGEFCENSAVRRLGYLLEFVGHDRQAKALEAFASKAKSLKSLDPSIKPIYSIPTSESKKNEKWRLVINQLVEIDF